MHFTQIHWCFLCRPAPRACMDAHNSTMHCIFPQDVVLNMKLFQCLILENTRNIATFSDGRIYQKEKSDHVVMACQLYDL